MQFLYSSKSVQLIWIYFVAGRSTPSSNFKVLCLCTRFPPGLFASMVSIPGSVLLCRIAQWEFFGMLSLLLLATPSLAKKLGQNSSPKTVTAPTKVSQLLARNLKCAYFLVHFCIFVQRIKLLLFLLLCVNVTKCRKSVGCCAYLYRHAFLQLYPPLHHTPSTVPCLHSDPLKLLNCMIVQLVIFLLTGGRVTPTFFSFSLSVWMLSQNVNAASPRTISVDKKKISSGTQGKTIQPC